MSILSIPPGDTFTVINATTVRYKGTDYALVSDILYPDGTHKTPGSIIEAAGGAAYASGELKDCVKVQGIDPDNNNRQVFSLYSSNSHQTAKNESASVPGNMWCEMFNFLGDGNSNYIVRMWMQAGKPGFSPAWIGFRLNYGVVSTRAYVITHVNNFLEESVPSEPSVIDVTYLTGVRVDATFKQPTPYQSTSSITGAPYVPIGQIRLYRSQTTSDGSFVFRYVPVTAHSDLSPDPFPHTTGFGPSYWTHAYDYVIRDFVRDEDLSSVVLPSIDWDAPPPDLMGLREGVNGYMVAYKGNNVYFSEPYRPHTWPEKYIISLPYQIVAIEQTGTTMVVITLGYTYIFTGAHPATMTYERLENAQSGKPALAINGVQGPSRAVCKTPNGVAYVCDDGIMLTSGGQVALLTQTLFTKTDWQSRYPDGFGLLNLAYSNGKILCYERNVNQGGFLMALDGSWLTDFAPAEAIWSSINLPGSDGLFCVSDTGFITSLRKFEHALAPGMVAVWVSKKFVFVKPYPMGCFQIVGSGTVTLSFVVDSAPLYTTTVVLSVDQPQTHRLPTGNGNIPNRARQWQVVMLLASGASVREFYLAGTPIELQGV